MNIYISGISGTGMGPLALMAHQAGENVTGSDRAEGAISPELKEAEIEYFVGEQDGSFIAETHAKTPIDWFVYTSALPKDHPELKFAEENGIKATKRDELIAYLVEKLGLKMIAVAGTHGKTTTTSMLVWAAKKLDVKAAYLVGTTLNFAPSGSYQPGDEYFIYEADEYDRNFLHFHPYLSAITFVSYDHPDIYKTREEYQEAFKQFESQSQQVIYGGEVNSKFMLAGVARREDATTALEVLKAIGVDASEQEIIDVLNEFPGVGRRFERLADGIYSDYAHHPEEVLVTVEMAKEEAARTMKRGVVAVYQPHQNTRQHQVRDGYKNAFDGVSKLFWIPTYLTREDPDLDVITPEEFIEDLSDTARTVAEPADLNPELIERLKQYLADNYLVLLMSAGPADPWLRRELM